MGHPHDTTEAISTRGREIHEQRLRRKWEPGNVGKFLVIDSEEGFSCRTVA